MFKHRLPNWTRVTLVSVYIVLSSGCVSVDYKDTTCTPSFKLTSSDPIKVYSLQWIDRGYSYSSFRIPEEDFFLCLQPEDVADTWCERRNLENKVEAKSLPQGATVTFTGAVVRVQNNNMDAIIPESTYFKGIWEDKVFWLDGVALLFLAREFPRFKDVYAQTFSAIGGEEMLDLYLDAGLKESSIWQCSI